MTGSREGARDAPTWTRLFERAPAHVSEATIRELLADHRDGAD